MWENMKLSQKIWLGFGSILGITVTLGVVAIAAMNSVRVKANLLGEEYVPEVKVANNIERSALQTMYAVRGYQYSGDEKFLKEGKENFAKVNSYLKEAGELANKSLHLLKLRDQVKVAQTNVDKYAELFTKTENERNETLKISKELAVSGDNFMKYSYEYLSSQDKKIRSSSSKNDMEYYYNNASLINDVVDLGNAVRINRFKTEAERNPEYIEKILPNFAQIYSKINTLKKTTNSSADLALLDNVAKYGAEYEKDAKNYLKVMAETNETSKLRREAGEEVTKAAEETSLAGIGQTDKIADDSSSSLTTTSWVLVFGLIAAFCLGALVAFIVARNIGNAIGNVTIKLRRASEETATAAEQLSSASQRLAEGATEQASSLQETAATIEELNSMIQKATEGANKASQITTEAENQANQGKHAVEKVLNSMQSIETSNYNIMHQVQESNEKISDIVKIINEIGNKTKVINEIVFQTKLLSFNASVEAARAGEHGKGFAVVAEEVGNLAQMSGNAAKEIEAMLTGSVHKVEAIVTETKTKVEAIIADGKIKVEEGRKMVEACENVLDKIVAGSSTAARVTNEVSQASEQQAQGINEISSAVSQLDQVTQANAATAEESSAAAEKLTEQAIDLNESVTELVWMVEGKTANYSENYNKPAKRYEAKSSTLSAASQKIGGKVIALKSGLKFTKKNAPVKNFEQYNPSENNQKAVGFDGVPHANDERFAE